MKPKEVVISDEDDDSVVSGSDVVVKKKRKKEKERKNKVPAGMALINGFTAANVGRGRLTVCPTTSRGPSADPILMALLVLGKAL
jgi:hypothetical protein